MEQLNNQQQIPTVESVITPGVDTMQEAKTPRTKTATLKNIMVLLGIVLFALWAVWFACDCYFISEGLPCIFEEITQPWNQQWYLITKNIAAVLLAFLGGYLALLVAYMVSCGLKLKQNLKQNLYLLITIAAAFIALTIPLIKASQMMIDEKFVISITSLELYHLDYLKWMSIPAGVLIFATVILAGSFRGFNYKTVIRDVNILLISLAIALVLLFPGFLATVGWHDNLDWISDTWIHIVCQCITSPIGTFAGMVMVLMVARLILVMFVYNDRLREKKSHIIIFCIITALVFIAFIISHVNKMDFEKLILDYESMKIGCGLVVSGEVITCLAAGIYCSISHKNYVKRVD